MHFEGDLVYFLILLGIKLLKKYGAKHLEATMVVCKENEKYIRNFKELCEKLGVKDRLRILEPGGRIDNNAKLILGRNENEKTF